MADFDRGAALITLFASRLYDLKSKADRATMAAVINEAFGVTETAERERCAKIADADARAAQEQIDRNDEYKARSGSTDDGPNDLCRHRKYHSERIAADIRAAMFRPG